MQPHAGHNSGMTRAQHAWKSRVSEVSRVHSPRSSSDLAVWHVDTMWTRKKWHEDFALTQYHSAKHKKDDKYWKTNSSVMLFATCTVHCCAVRGTWVAKWIQKKRNDPGELYRIWNEVIWGWFPCYPHCVVTSWWGCFDSARLIVEGSKNSGWTKWSSIRLNQCRNITKET